MGPTIERMALDKYKTLFFTEADEKISALDAAILRLEKHPSDAQIAEVCMRAAHTLKSSAAAMEYMGISHLSHAMENVFEHVRTNQREVSNEDITLLFLSVDRLKQSLDRIKMDEPELDTASLVAQLGTVSPVSQPANTTAKEARSDPTNLAVIKPIESINVSVKTLDALMALTEELLVTRMRVHQLTTSLHETNTDLQTSVEGLDRLVNELQYQVTNARMLPLGMIFERFPRMVRDLARDTGKDIEFVIEGKNIELDRTVVDRLGEPLVHLLRNAVDHGIDKKGTVLLRATRVQDQVIIEIQDNGKGIDWKLVAEKLHIPDFETDRSKELLFSGVSTSARVTETSGRGVGLQIVKSAMSALGGAVSVESPNAAGGTTFRLKLPLTLAIIQALLVRSSDQVFALPFSQVDRSVRVSQKNIKKAFDQEVAIVDEEDIPIVRLNQLFQMNTDKVVLQDELMVVTKHAERQAGIVIDELISEQDIVVKPLKGILKQSKGLAGITLLGNGRPALILDVATLV